MSDFVGKEPCPKCGSRDNLARYSDGSGYCFGCKHYEHATDSVREQPTEDRPRMTKLLDGEYRPLAARGITEDTCKFLGYLVGSDDNGNTVQIAQYWRDGKVIAQKVRGKDKKFKVVGEGKSLPFFGQHKFGDTNGKRVVITEGEIDALTISQLQGNKWPVVSVPNGAQGASNTFKREIEWLEQFEEVVLAFDMDEPGQSAALECAQLLSPGKAKIAHLPAKDANEAHLMGLDKELLSSIWEAKPYRPDGLVEIEDLIDEAEKPVEIGLPWCFPTLTRVTYGRRYGEIYAIGAGTGIGKTDFFTQQIEFDMNTLKLKVGVIYLEQDKVETARRIAGKAAGKRFHVPDSGWTKQELRDALNSLRGKATLYDSFGETDWEVIKGKIRYMAVSLGIRIIYLDHLTAMADTANEKESLEQIMKEMASLAKSLGVVIHFVSHLSTPEGKPHEEGGRVMIRHFKGSRAIGFWSYFMFGMERDQQDENQELRSITTFRILKDRYTGQATGVTFALGYDAETGRLYEREFPKDAETMGFKDESNGDF